MYAIANIVSSKNDRYCAVTVTNCECYYIHEDDIEDKDIGDTVLIQFHPDDQFAKLIPVEEINTILMNRDVSVFGCLNEHGGV